MRSMVFLPSMHGPHPADRAVAVAVAVAGPAAAGPAPAPALALALALAEGLPRSDRRNALQAARVRADMPASLTGHPSVSLRACNHPRPSLNPSSVRPSYHPLSPIEPDTSKA